MLDAVLLAAGLIFFGAMVLYTRACERLWRRHASRSCTRCRRHRGPAGLPRLRSDPAGAVL